MAVYMDHKAHAPYPGQMTDIQWHKTSPILAVASQQESGVGMVNFYLEEVIIWAYREQCLKIAQYVTTFFSFASSYKLRK